MATGAIFRPFHCASVGLKVPGADTDGGTGWLATGCISFRPKNIATNAAKLAPAMPMVNRGVGRPARTRNQVHPLICPWSPLFKYRPDRYQVSLAQRFRSALGLSDICLTISLQIPARSTDVTQIRRVPARSTE